MFIGKERGMILQKILLAIGFRQLEEYLKKQMKEFLFVGETVYREGIVRAIGQKKPDIVIIRETLEGTQDILSVLYEIRAKYPKVRIVFLAGNRKPGDVLLATVVSYGIYDVLYGDKILAQHIIDIVRNPNEYVHVQHLLPKVILDEERNKILYDAPDIEHRIIEKEIFVQKERSETDETQKEGMEKKEYVTQTEMQPTQESKEFLMDDFFEEDHTRFVEQPKETLTSPDSEENNRSQLLLKKNDPLLSVMKEHTKKLIFREKKSSHVTNVQEKTQAVSEHHSPFQRKEIDRVIGTKMVSFVGAKEGVGTTTVSYFVSYLLAKKGRRVLYIDPKDFPSVSYWYEVGYLDVGLEKAIEGMEREEYQLVKESIYRGELLKEKYKDFPSSLDFLVFSQAYMARKERDRMFDPYLVKDLYLYLLFHADYEYIIVDLAGNFDSFFHYGLVYAKSVFLVTTQDVAAMGSGIFLCNEIKKQYTHETERSLFWIVNMFNKKILTIDDVQKCMEEKIDFYIPDAKQEVVKNQFLGIPSCFRSSEVLNQFEKVVSALS